MAAVTGLAGITPGLTPTPSQTPARVPAGEFRDTLQGLRDPATGAGPANAQASLKFSNHAVERMQLRGIRFDPMELKKINEAVDKAAAKGARNTLLVTDSSAMIVSVKDRTVVTVLDRVGMKDNVFTNIDSTVVV